MNASGDIVQETSRVRTRYAITWGPISQLPTERLVPSRRVMHWSARVLCHLVSTPIWMLTDSPHGSHKSSSAISNSQMED